MNVGDQVSRDTVPQLPIGTVLTYPEYGPGHRYYERYRVVVAPDGLAQGTGGQFVTSYLLASEGYRIESIGNGGEQYGFLGFEAYKQFFATQAVGKATAASVALAPIDTLLLRFGAGDTNLRVGMWIHAYDRRFTIPDGTLGRFGLPGSYTDEGYVVRRGNEWADISLGQRSQPGHHLVQVLSFPEGTSVTEPFPARGEGDVERINDFRLRAWRAGLEAKSANNWCGDFERAMDRCGINEHTVRTFVGVGTPAAPGSGLTLGQRCDPAMALSAPVGTVFRSTNRDTGEFHSFHLRVESGGSPSSGCVRLLDNVQRNNRTVEVVHLPGQPMNIVVQSREELSEVPPGTQMRVTQPDGGPHWQRTNDGRWRSLGAGSVWGDEEFSINGALAFCSIPGVQ